MAWMQVRSRLVLQLALPVLLGLAIPLARAGESPFGWLYTTDVMPRGRTELELQAFLQHGQSRGHYDYLLQRLEVEHGVGERVQVAGYFNWSSASARGNGVDGRTGGPGIDAAPSSDPAASYRSTRFESLSFETIWQLRNPLTQGYGLALYLEPEIGPRERALEWRAMWQLNRRDDRLIIAANLFGAHEREREADGEVERASMLDLSVGFSYRFRDRWSAGLELRNHREFTGLLYGAREHSAWFLGPNLHYAARHAWLTLAWRSQLPLVQTYSADQQAVTVGHRIYGSEHARDEFMFKFGVPL